MKIKPLFDRILLKPYIPEKNTKLFTNVENEGNKMEVIATGTNENFIVKIGDLVLINKYSGSEFVIENDTFVLIKETDILAVIKENENE